MTIGRDAGSTDRAQRVVPVERERELAAAAANSARISESFGKRGLAWVIAGLVPTNPARVSTGQNGLP